MRTVWFLFLLFVAPANSCPSLCRCSVLKVKKKDDGNLSHKVTCNRLNLTSMDQIEISLIPNDTVSLTISSTALLKVKIGVFSTLDTVVKLDLSKNKIIHIDNFAFSNMTALKRLNLSYNSITVLGPDVFSEIPYLEKLDLKANPLMCDCHLQWLLSWYRENNIKISPGTTCQYPAQLRDIALVKLSTKDAHCNNPLQLPTFELRPSVNQLVFEGDSFTFQCRVSDIDSETKLIWLRNSQPVENKELSLDINELSDSGILISYLSVDSIILNHTGTWMCYAVTKRGNLSRTVDIIVVSQKNPPCPEEVTQGNKGQYHWPHTLGGIMVELPCFSISPAVLAYRKPQVYRICGVDGLWEVFDAAECPYVSEVTNILEQFAKTNLSESKTVVDTARGLRNYTGNGSGLTDVMDVVYITQTMENFLALVPQHKELGEILLDVISAILGRSRNLLKLAQVEDKTCNKLLQLIDSLAVSMADSSINHFHPNLIVEEFLVKSESFPGMRCTSFQDSSSFWGRNLHCVSVNATLPLIIDKPVEASIYVPPSVFGSSKKNNQRAISTSSIRGAGHKLQFVLYRESVLFPRPNLLGEEEDVTSPVISCQTVPAQTKSLSQPIEVTLQVPAFTSDAKPVRWDANAADGKGDWLANECVINSVVGRSITFSCNYLGVYGVLQDLKLLRQQLHYQQAQFRLTHPAVYVGSIICFSFLIMSIIIFYKEWKNIKMPKKMKHSLLNSWIAMAVTLLIFTSGGTQTDFALVCQIVGLSIHYLTLCTLVWMIITANNMYKHLTRNDPIDLPPDEPPPDPTVPPKPMMQFYLVGWGVGTIVCGISAAVHINAYHNASFCFLSNTSSLAAFYGPVSVFFALLLIYFLTIRCHYNREIETSGVYLVGSPTNTNADTESLIDLEFCPSSQLRALIIVLFLFAGSWASAAITVARPFSHILPYDTLIFGLIYCVFSAILGTFIFSYYCYLRKYVGKQFDWWNFSGNGVRSLRYEERGPVVHITENLVDSVPKAVDYHLPNTITLLPNDTITPNVNLLSSHAPTNDHVNTTGVELFYNPRQSIVAKKFFEKNRRQQQLKALKKNNLAKAQNSETEPFTRTRAYSDTEKASSTYRSGVEEERSHLCTSQSYSGAAVGLRSDFKENPTKTALNVQNGLVEIHPEPLMVNKPSSPNKLNSQEYYRNVPLSKNCSKPIPSRFSTMPSCDRSSCSECSKCNRGKPASLCSQSCYSDFTSVSQNAQKRRSRSSRSKWRKNSRQYSWDDKYDNNGVKMFLQASPTLVVPMGVEIDNKAPPVMVSRSNSKRKHKRRGDSRGSTRSRDRGFARSQSAYEQITVNIDKAVTGEGANALKSMHQETEM